MKVFLTTILLSFFSILSAFDPTIPVLHLPDFYNKETRNDFLKKLEKAATELGFFALTGMEIDVELLDQAYEQLKGYFALDLNEKMAMHTPDGQRGYTPGESAKDEKQVDYKEFFHIGRELSKEDLKRLQYCQNIWPHHPKNFQKKMQELYKVLDSCKEAIGEAFEYVLEQEPHYLNQMTKEGDCLMRALHYPPSPSKNVIWAAAHTNINLFTIFPKATAQGLQLLNGNNEWIDIIVPDGAFIINCGDMLENLTNGYFRSASHRVIDPGLKQDRYSIVFFVHPRSDDLLNPLPCFIKKTGGIRKYANVNRIELLAERLIDLGLASHELMEFFFNSGAIEKLKEVNRFSSKAEAALIKAGVKIN